MSFEIAVQKVIFDILNADSDVTGKVTGIFDAVPQDQQFPYITIGEDVHTEWDTFTEQGTSASITIHVWSRYRGRLETKTIQGAIYDALSRADAQYMNYAIIAIDFEQSQSFMDSDGLTRHGVQTFRVLTERI